MSSRGPTAYAPTPDSARGAYQTPDRQLPGLSNLFASGLLINSDSKPDRSDAEKSDPSHACSLARYSLSHRPSPTRPDSFDPPDSNTLSPISPGWEHQTYLHARGPAYPSPLPSPSIAHHDARARGRVDSVGDGIMVPAYPLASPSSSTHSGPPSPPYELSPSFFGSAELAPATYVYQAASSYEGVQVVPGKGECHVYKGGYCIPTHLLGEPMDLTKSKILKKRLSVACSGCRRKKIRCEPGGADGCLQCRKSQRPCQM
jgi:hypothetical protein